MKPNKYQGIFKRVDGKDIMVGTVTVPEPKVVSMPKGNNREARRKLLLGYCPCGSGRKYAKCHLPIEKRRRDEMTEKELGMIKVTKIKEQKDDTK